MRWTTLKQPRWGTWTAIGASVLAITGVAVFWLARYGPLLAQEVSAGAAGGPGQPSAASDRDIVADGADASALVVKTDVVRTDCNTPHNTYPGVVRASRTAKLSFRVGGPVVQVEVEPGDFVKKGDLLMEVDPRDYENQVAATKAALAGAKAKLTAMKNGAREEDVRSLEAGLDAAVARRDFARQQFDRFKELVARNAVAKAQFDNIQSEMLAAEAAVISARQELVKAKAGAREEDILAMESEISGLQVRLEAAENALEDTRIMAPFDGVVTERFLEQHEMVAPGAKAVAMHDIQQLEIDVHLPEQELVHRSLTEAFPANVSFLAAPGREYEARQCEIKTQADPVTRAYLVTFAMPAPEDVRILPGMTAELKMPNTAPTSDATPLYIPAAAILSDHTKQQFVWVVTDKRTAERRVIKTGALTDDDCYTVLSGLKEGERIVVGGGQRIVEGMPLAPVQAR